MSEAAASAKTVMRAESADAAAVAGDPADTLGQIVQRNQKLNEWLRDMVGEEAHAEGNLKVAGRVHEQQTAQTKA